MFLRKRMKGVFRALIPVLISIAFVAAFTFFLTRADRRAADEGLNATFDSLRRAAVQCYALDGAYPADLDDLIVRGGVTPDLNRYVVYYEFVASNLLPDITVLPAE